MTKKSAQTIIRKTATKTSVRLIWTSIGCVSTLAKIATLTSLTHPLGRPKKGSLMLRSQLNREFLNRECIGILCRRLKCCRQIGLRTRSGKNIKI